MCVVIGTTAAYILMAASAATAVVGTAYAMNQEKKAAAYNEQVDLQNSKLANVQAANANAQGSYMADQARIRGNLQRGSQLASFAANNVDVTTGSAADILGDTAMVTATNERQARINAAQRAYGFQVQSLTDQGAASYAKWQGQTQQTSTLISGMSSVMGSFSRMGSGFGGTGNAGMNTGGSVITGGMYNGSTSSFLGSYGP